MPSRWWIPVRGVNPKIVRLEHLHAAVSAWFDHDGVDHSAVTKPYALSPLGGAPTGDIAQSVGFEVSVLTDQALTRLRSAAGAGQGIRLGGQLGTLGRAVGMARESWESLAEPSGARTWELDFVTPVTFRSRNRSAPWPAPPAVMRGLVDSWNCFSGLAPRELSHQQLDTVWVSDIAGASEPMVISDMRISGFVGQVRYRCDDLQVADIVDSLFRLSVYSGVGTAKAKGLGVTRFNANDRRPARQAG